jgi:hypothetical protein
MFGDAGLTVSLKGAKTNGVKAMGIRNNVSERVNSSFETLKRSCPAEFTMATLEPLTAVRRVVASALRRRAYFRVVDQLMGL